MTITAQDLTPGTIVLGIDGRIAIITELKPSNTKYPIIYSFKTDARGYKGNVSDFRAILGIVDLDVWNEHKLAPQPKFMGDDDDALVPEALKGIKIGDKIDIRTRTGSEIAIYGGYNYNRPKYPVSFTNAKGRSMKGGLNIVIRKHDEAKS